MDELAAALGAFSADEIGRVDLAGELKTWGVHANTIRAIDSRLGRLAEVVRTTAARLPRFVAAAGRVEGAKLAGFLQKLNPRPGPAMRICTAALNLLRATPPFSAALAHALLPVVQSSLARSKRVAGAYDFDDMLVLLDQGLRGPGGSNLAESMRRRWRYALVDEFQDTDWTQWSIFRTAFFERTAAQTRSFVFLVGDPKQSIYRFRGADVDTYFRATEEVTASGGSLVTLDQNYRATPSLVLATNSIFDQKEADPFFTGAIAYAPVGCARSDRELVDGSGRQVSAVHLVRFPRELILPLLGRIIAREIRSMTDPFRPWRLDGRPLRYSDAFVLTRTAWEGRLIGAALRAEGVPHAFYKEDGLFQSDEANDIRALLSAIADPTDHASRLAAWLTPFFGLPLEAAESARDLPSSHPLVARLEAWRALAEGREFDRLFESILIDSRLVRREIFFADSERALTNTQHIFEVLLERVHAGHKTLRDLVIELSGLKSRTRLPLDIEGNVQRLENERPAVQIMTIHKAKGLEAPVVFVAGGASAPREDDVHIYHEEGRRAAWVGRPSLDVEPVVKSEEREEDQRLLYVALTRAMGRLVLPCIVDAAGAKRLRGPYDGINRRLFELSRQGADWLTIEDAASGQALPSGSSPGSNERSGWSPPIALLSAVPVQTVYDALRSRAAGARLTSYTRMRARDAPGRGARAELANESQGDASVDSDDDVVHLQASRQAGVFLHALLERVPLATFATDDIAAWRNRPDIAAPLAEEIAAHRIDPRQREHAERLVWNAYTTPIGLPRGERVERLATARRIEREMEFAFVVSASPIAKDAATEDAATEDAATESAASRTPRYVRGFLDLAFEHQGRTYGLDWKSDSLETYAKVSLERRVAQFYEAQLKIYVLALTRLLGAKSEAEYEERFGGFLYCFLRGVDRTGRGLWSTRPGWSEILAWEEDIRLGRLWASGSVE
jgi:exodeoxyribonuclease V beta subunit